MIWKTAFAIRPTKFRKSRFVPIDDSTRQALARYAKQRNRLDRRRATEAFFVSERGQRLAPSSTRKAFAKLSCAIGFGVGAHVRCFGKGRKMRRTRLRPDVAAVLKDWLAQQAGQPDDPVFPSSNGRRLSADALQRPVSKHVATACQRYPSLKAKKVKPHTLRHAAAMALLRRGVDLSVIALWLGHESTETTQINSRELSCGSRSAHKGRTRRSAPKHLEHSDVLRSHKFCEIRSV